MNKSNFIQTGGYPLKSERLQELQTAYSIFNSLGALAGNLTIISGCKLEGTTIKNGCVYIDGELFEFREAAITANSTVIIIEEVINRGFKNGANKQVHTIRYATFGTAATSWPWTDFKPLIEIKNIPLNLVNQLVTIGNKEDKTTVDQLRKQIESLEDTISNLIVPKIIIDSDQRTVTNHQLGDNYNNTAKNYIDVYPPSGYTMANLAGFMASISQLKFSGDVNHDDGLWCKYANTSSYVRVICGASEMREISQVSYMAIWIKY